MAQTTQVNGPGNRVSSSSPGTAANGDPTALVTAPAPTTEPMDKDKVLPLPGWLKKAYFIFPVVLYIPDVIFNFYVYSDGAHIESANPVIQAGQVALWGFLSIGVVGMAYLLSVLAPWHWGQGHRVQAFFCGIGVLIATAITTWNSLAYRSTGFQDFPTDKWMYQLWPQLQSMGVSVTMILVAIAPPFWGLFWAIVQPTETGRSLRQIQESHAERVLRMQQEAELKRIRAETNAKIREAQLRGMAQTAATAREQAKALLTQRNTGGQAQSASETSSTDAAAPATDTDPALPAASVMQDDPDPAPNVLQLPTFTPSTSRDPSAGRNTAMYNQAPSTPAAQPMLLHNPDVSGIAGRPASDVVAMRSPRTPPTIGRGINAFFPAEDELDSSTGTTGPRPAVRRPGDSAMLRALNEGGLDRIEAAMKKVAQQLSANGTRGKSVSLKELTAGVAAELNIDETAARSGILRVREAQKARRG